MSDSDNSSFANFGKFVPGFDFLQNLATQAAGSAAQKIPQLPNLGNWVAPTLNVDELDKRIDELKSVQFWLDQNAMALNATIQALEVQKMTLATLKGMNFNMGDVANAFKLKVSDSLAGGVQKVADKARTFSGLEIPPSSFLGNQAKDDEDSEGQDTEDSDAEEEEESPEPRASSKGRSSKNGKGASAAAVVDPMQWWGSLTQQFQTIAADAMKEAAKKTALDATRNIAGGLAKDAMKTATDMATGIAKGMATSAAKTVTGGARAAMNSALRSTNAWPTPGAGKAGAKAATLAVRKAAAKPAAKTSTKTSTKTSGKSTTKTSAKTGRKTAR